MPSHTESERTKNKVKITIKKRRKIPGKAMSETGKKTGK